MTFDTSQTKKDNLSPHWIKRSLCILTVGANHHDQYALIQHVKNEPNKRLLTQESMDHLTKLPSFIGNSKILWLLYLEHPFIFGWGNCRDERQISIGYSNFVVIINLRRSLNSIIDTASDTEPFNTLFILWMTISSLGWPKLSTWNNVA